MKQYGAGEILLTSMDQDGRQNGYDLALTAAVSESVGTKALLANVSGKTKTKSAAWTASGVRTTIARVTPTHEKAKLKISNNPNASAQLPGPPCGRNPTSNPTIVITMTATTPRNKLKVRPVTTALRDIGNERKRSIKPLERSFARPIPLNMDPREDQGLHKDASHEVVDVARSLDVDRATEHKAEQQHEDDRLDRDVEQQLWRAGDVQDIPLRPSTEHRPGPSGSVRRRPPAARRPLGCTPSRNRGFGDHAASCSDSARWPVSARKTSSRVGRCRPASSSSIPSPCSANVTSVSRPGRASTATERRR